MRLDKLVSQACGETRSRAREHIRNGSVSVNGEVVKRPEFSIDEDSDSVCVLGKPLKFQKYHYYMLNKPQGVVTATRDNRERTVMDLMSGAQGKDLFPVGRLDKDTVGLLIITNDGETAHRLLSPKRHVEKTYYAECEGIFSEDSLKCLLQGVDIGDDKPTLPAGVKLISSEENKYAIELTITEGRYHQVKRMVQAVGGEVEYLKRIKFGGLSLDDTLAEGQWRELSQEEIYLLTSKWG